MTDTLVERLTKERDYLDGMLKAASETVDFAQAKLKAQASRIAELEGEIVLGSERMADLCIIVPPKHASAVARWADELRKALEDQTLSNGGGE